jgi:hypothetical protein
VRSFTALTHLGHRSSDGRGHDSPFPQQIAEGHRHVAAAEAEANTPCVATATEETCAKLGITFWDYLGDRLTVASNGAIPYLPELVSQQQS